MAFFSESGLSASRHHEKMRLCEKCGLSLEYKEGEGWCCPKGHGCSWPAEHKEPPEPNKARCYHQGEIVPTGQSKGRSRKKKPKKDLFSKLYQED